jgi:hypothetical protein
VSTEYSIVCDACQVQLDFVIRTTVGVRLTDGENTIRQLPLFMSEHLDCTKDLRIVSEHDTPLYAGPFRGETPRAIVNEGETYVRQLITIISEPRP